MARAVVRLFVGLLLVSAGALVLAPLMASPGSPTPDLIVSRLPGQTGPTVTLTFVTTTTLFTVRTTPPVSSSVLTTPTTTSTSPTTKRHATASTSTTSTSSTSTTTTTVAPIPVAAPPPVTLPLASLPQSGNINAFFPILSGIGFLTLIGLLAAQWVLTTPGHKGPTL